MYDRDIGLVRFGARDYDPETGRWTEKDPVRFNDGPNVYVYSQNDAINYLDFEGKGAVLAGAVIVAGGVIIFGILDKFSNLIDKAQDFGDSHSEFLDNPTDETYANRSEAFTEAGKAVGDAATSVPGVGPGATPPTSKPGVIVDAFMRLIQKICGG